MSIQNRIFKNGKHWELISGPWTIAEAWLMSQHIDSFKPHIECTTEEHNGNIYVYRCAKGYINERSSLGKSMKQGKPKDKVILSEFRKIQREIQQSMMQKLCLDK